MMNLVLMACCVLPALFILATSVVAIKAVKKGANKKIAVVSQIASVAFIMLMCFFIPGICKVAGASEKQTASTSEASSTQSKDSAAIGYSVGLIAAAASIGLSAIGGGIAVASAAPAAIAATSEDPKAFGKSLIFVALGEGIALYGLLVSIMIFSKIDQLLGG